MHHALAVSEGKSLALRGLRPFLRDGDGIFIPLILIGVSQLVELGTRWQGFTEMSDRPLSYPEV
jgi:hypothetical protein